MEDESKSKQLWNVLSKDDRYKKFIGDYETFDENVQDPAKLKKLYGVLSKDNRYKKVVGDEETFTNNLKKKSPYDNFILPELPQPEMAKMDNTNTNPIDVENIPGKELTPNTDPEPEQVTQEQQGSFTIKDYISSRKVNLKDIGLPEDINQDKQLTGDEMLAYDTKLNIKESVENKWKEKEFKELPAYKQAGVYAKGTIRAVNESTEQIFRNVNGLERFLSNVLNGVSGGKIDGGDGVMGKVADWFHKSKVEGAQEMPDNILGNTLKSLGGLNGLFIELALPVDIKVNAINKVTAGLMTGISPLITISAYDGFAGTYEKIDKENVKNMDKFTESLKAGGEGAVNGAFMTLMGYVAAGAGMGVATKTKSQILGSLTNMVTNSAGFAGHTAALGEDKKAIIESGVFGATLAIPTLAKAAYGTAFTRWSTTPMEMIDNIKKLNLDPVKLRAESDKLQLEIDRLTSEYEFLKNHKSETPEDKALYEAKIGDFKTIPERIQKLLIAKRIIDASIEINAIDKDVIARPDEYKDMINNDEAISAQEKAELIKKIDTTVLDADATYEKAKPIISELKDLEKELKSIQDNTAMDKFTKNAKSKLIQTKIKDAEARMENVLSGKDLIKEKPGEARDEVAIDKEISAAQQRLGLPVKPEVKIPETVLTTLDKIAKGEPVTNNFIKEAADILLGEFNRLGKMKEATKRQFTLDQIKEQQNDLAEKITKLDEYEAKQEKSKEFVKKEDSAEPIKEPVKEPAKPEVKPEDKPIEEEPVEPPVKKPVEEIKEPAKVEKKHWEMTKDEFEEYFSNEDNAEIKSTEIKDIGNSIKPEEIESISKKYPDQIDYLRFLSIRKALSEGKNVPEEILKEYPELKTGEKPKAPEVRPEVKPEVKPKEKPVEPAPEEKPVEEVKKPRVNRIKEPWEISQEAFLKGRRKEYEKENKSEEEISKLLERQDKLSHRVAIEKAVEEGKPIPESVMKDYKDLIPEAPETPNMNDFVDWVIKYSQNKDEIFMAFEYERDNNAPYKQLEDWQTTVLGLKFKEKSFTDNTDPNIVTDGLAKRFFRKDGMAMDQVAKDMLGWEGSNADIQKITDFVLDVVKDPSITRKTTDAQNEARTRFKQITGYSIDNYKKAIKDIDGMMDADPDIKVVVREFTNDGQVDWDNIKHTLENNRESLKEFPFSLTEENLIELEKIIKDENRRKRYEDEPIRDSEDEGEAPEEVFKPSDKRNEGGAGEKPRPEEIVKPKPIEEVKKPAEPKPKEEVKPKEKEELPMEDLIEDIETLEQARERNLNARISHLSSTAQKDVKQGISKLESSLDTMKNKLKETISDLKTLRDRIAKEKNKQGSFEFGEKEPEPIKLQDLVFEIPKDFSQENIDKIIDPLKKLVQRRQSEFVEAQKKLDPQIDNLIKAAENQGEMEFNNSISDVRRAEIAEGKLATLKAIQEGRIEEEMDFEGIKEAPNPIEGGGQFEFAKISDKAFVVRGDAMPIKDLLKGLKGMWNKKENAWMFPLSRLEEVKNAINPEPSSPDVLKSAKNTTELAKMLAEGKVKEDSAFNQRMEELRIAESEQSSKIIRSQRIQPEKDQFGVVKPLRKILSDLSTGLDHKIRYGKTSRSTSLGDFNFGTSLLRLRKTNNLSTAIHEAGHLFDAKYNIYNKLTDSILKELDKDIFSATNVPPPGHPDPEMYKVREQIAEWIRAYALNPKKAVELAPEFHKLYNELIPDDIKAVINRFSSDVRAWYSSDAMEKIGANIKSDAEKVTFWEKAVKPFKKSEMFGLNWIDKVNSGLLNQRWGYEKAFLKGLERGGGDISKLAPSKNTKTLIKLLAGFDDKFFRIYESGMIDSQLNFIKDKDGNNKNWKWLLELANEVTDGSHESVKQFVTYVEDVMVGKRTIELIEEKLPSRQLIADLGNGLLPSDFILQRYQNVMGVKAKVNFTPESLFKRLKASGLEPEMDKIIELLDMIGDKPTIGTIASVLKMLELKSVSDGRYDFTESDVTGIGGGLLTDYLVAKESMSSHKNLKYIDPKRWDIAEKMADRYQSMADDVLRYMRDGGRISNEMYSDIKRSNLEYVALKRIIETGVDEAVVLFSSDKAGKIGVAQKVIHTIEGSTKTIIAPYAALMENLYKSIKETDRNNAMLAFVDVLRPTSNDGQSDFADIGFQTKQGDKNVITVFKNGEAQYWRFDKDVYESLMDVDGNSGRVPKGLNFMTIYAKVLRFSVTKSPQFAARNRMRDFMTRLIYSSGNFNIHDYFNKADARAEFELAGGGQFGYHLRDRQSYHELQGRAIKDMARENGTHLLSAKSADKINFIKLYHNYVEQSERATRIEEYKGAYRKAKEDGMSDFDAKLYATERARDLLDFKVNGYWMQSINQVVPFANARVQGMRKMIREAKDNPLKFTARWMTYAMLPQVVNSLLIKYCTTDDQRKGYLQFAHYRRDLFYNIPIGNGWLTIPKPFELGVIASMAGRVVDRYLLDDDDGFKDGYVGWLTQTMSPMSPDVITGGMNPIRTIQTNWDPFRQKYIVPPYEKQIAIELRKGTEKASNLSKILTKLPLLKKSDPRFVDQFIKEQFSYFGDMAIKASDIGRDKVKPVDLSMTGLYKNSALYGEKNVQWLINTAKLNQRTNDENYVLFSDMMGYYFNQKEGPGKDSMERQVRNFAKFLRKNWEIMKYDDPNIRKKELMVKKLGR